MGLLCKGRPWFQQSSSWQQKVLWFKMVMFPMTKFSGREGIREEFSLLLQQMIFFFQKYPSDFGLETLKNF